MRLIDADSEISKIKDEIERYKEGMQRWNDNKTDRRLYDVDLKIKNMQRDITDAEIEIKCLKRYETVSDKEIRDKAIEQFVNEAMKRFTEFDLKHGYPTAADCKIILQGIAEQMREVK